MNSLPSDVLQKSIQRDIDNIIAAASRIILGKDRVLRQALTCIFSRGHLLIEDLPGVGKTTLSQVMARTLGLDYQRIQFTSDLLPADILGVSVYNRDTATFTFHPGPIFTNILLADEINRATPRSQSALLEAMEEHQVTIENETRPLPDPFFVIATQNPAHQIGTFPLPESQLDRFMMRIELGYPDLKAERELLTGTRRRELLQQTEAVISVERLLEIQRQVDSVHVSSALLDYLQDLLDFSRNSNNFRNGLSPRAGLAIIQCARAWAMMNGRTQVLPEDIQAILPAVAGHRLQAVEDFNADTDISGYLIKKVPVP